MLKRYRCIFVATGGLALLLVLFLGAHFGCLDATNTDHYQSDAAYGGEANPSDKTKNGLADITGMDGYTERIIAKPKPKDSAERENRDLAAQENSAIFAYWVFWAVVLQTFLAGGALIALLVDLSQNRKSAEAQLRAYITVEPGGVNESDNGFNRISYNLTNCGQTPAYDICIFGDILIVEGRPKDFNPITDGRMGDASATSDHTLGPGRNHWISAYQKEEFFSPYFKKIRKKETAIVHYGFVQYRDAFGKSRKTHFAFYHWGDELSDIESKTCRFGNHAT